MAGKTNILVIDDEQGIRSLLKSMLERKGHRVQCAGSAEEGLELAAAEYFDLVITDLRLLGLSGEEAVSRLKEARPNVPVVVISAFGSHKSVVDVIKRGAEDYLAKPFTPEDLEIVVFKVLQKQKLLRENERLRLELSDPGDLGGLVGRSLAMEKIRSLLRKIAGSPSNVLVTGESGTGKELVARAIHRLSTVSKGPFLQVNAGSLPATLFEAELFGVKKGAYTGAGETREGLFQAAHGGSLFLDEVGEIPMESQAKLLRVLESGEIKSVGEARPRKVDVRVISATNQKLEEMIQAGRFRKDLFYRLSTLVVHMPPLRERLDDISLLSDHFLGGFTKGKGPVKHLTSEALKKMMAHEWPGNIRELRNVLERASLLMEGLSIKPEDIVLSPDGSEAGARPRGLFQSAKRNCVVGFEKQYLQDALRESGGNITKAAQGSGLARRNFQNLIKKHRLDPRSFRKPTN